MTGEAPAWSDLLSDYVCAGFSPEHFWSITPREFGWHMRGAARRIEREHDAALWQAWHAAAFARVEKMPRLDELRRKPAAAARKTPEQIEAALMAWSVAMERAQ